MGTKEPVRALKTFVSLFGLMPFGGWCQTCQNCAVLDAKKPANGPLQRAESPRAGLWSGTWLLPLVCIAELLRSVVEVLPSTNPKCSGGVCVSGTPTTSLSPCVQLVLSALPP